MTSGDRSQESLIAQLTTVQMEASERMALLLEELSAQAVAERERAAELASALALAKAELEVARADREATLDSAREAAAREARLREELAVLRTQYQEILDSQALKLLQLTRDLATQTPPADTPAPLVRFKQTTGQDDAAALDFSAIDGALAATPL